MERYSREDDTNGVLSVRDRSFEKENSPHSANRGASAARSRPRRRPSPNGSGEEPLRERSSPAQRREESKVGTPPVHEEKAEDERASGDGGGDGNFKGASNDPGDDGEEEERVLEIPDLEENLRANAAPSAPERAAAAWWRRQLPTLEELDAEPERVIPVAAADDNNEHGDINLSVLARRLVPPDKLRETDEVWEFDSLLREAARWIDGSRAGGDAGD